MSVNDQPPSADTSNSHVASQLFASDLDALDHRLNRLSEDVLPAYPYLLTLPTNAPFRLGSRAANHWAVGHDRPFNPEEQQLQYMTFLAHHDTDSLLVAVGDWSDETGRMTADRPTPPSTAEPPKETVSKKKISLKDYKSQKTGGSAASPAISDHLPQEKPDTGLRADTQQAPDPAPIKKSASTDPAKSMPRLHSNPPSEKSPKKRPSTSDLEPLNPPPNNGPAMHTPKKARLSPEKDTRAEQASAKPHSPRLPALLSPTLPPTSAPRLPRLLSPTLPPDIEKELSRLEERSPLRTSPKNDATASKSRRDDAVTSKAPQPANSASNSSLQNDRADDVSVHPFFPSLVVRLRYGKSNRKRVEGLLKFSGKRRARQPDSPSAHDTGVDSIRGNGSSERIKSQTKHEAGETGQSSNRGKESRGPAEKARTPASRPSIAHDKAKSTSLTPVKDPKGSILRRHDAGDSDGKTPVNPPNEHRAWRDDSTRFTRLGRELKHSVVRFTSSGASITDEKLGVVTAIEAIMSFILAFVAGDQAKAAARLGADSTNWLSILPYWRVVKKQSISYPALHSLCLFLGAISYSAIHAQDLERLAISPIPGEHTPMPTPGSDGNTVPSDENKKSRRDFLELKNRLLECYKESQGLWLEGMRGLSEDILSRDFPITWSQRSHNYLERGTSPLKLGKYSGDYFLPLGGTSAPIEVVRFGWSLLKEWCAQEGVEWTGRLGL
ncbi:hypothetical protein N7492_009317 [Penicillium capsulatum]|uniref:Ell binding protein Ebp1 C-terminal domain-containing protein n=1 Tax=Penicillium capsulatum TaxID=69766 RepID=A0A9W9HWX1_9EURO|nr:hypothetical protein N7492_009317 [Penicillium capsulatum]